MDTATGKVTFTKAPPSGTTITFVIKTGVTLYQMPVKELDSVDLVTVDGETRTFDHVWLAPAMKGRYYGGGMMIAPGQLRGAADGRLTVVVLHCRSKLKTLIAFPGIFKGEHVKHTEMVEILTGHTIEVKFDRPTALQVDGETIKNVESYVIKSAAVAGKELEFAEAK